MGKAIIKLNLGCGLNHLCGYTNVDNWGQPDFKHDLNTFPYPWLDNSVDAIEMNHVLEHIPNWWECFKECARILKVGARLQINVPDESSIGALTYRDHYHVFSMLSFHGTWGCASGASSWAAEEEGTVPLRLVTYAKKPFPQYRWFPDFLLSFCAKHLRNFIEEQQFTFVKIGDE